MPSNSKPAVEQQAYPFVSSSCFSPVFVEVFPVTVVEVARMRGAARRGVNRSQQGLTHATESENVDASFYTKPENLSLHEPVRHVSPKAINVCVFCFIYLCFRFWDVILSLMFTRSRVLKLACRQRAGSGVDQRSFPIFDSKNFGRRTLVRWDGLTTKETRRGIIVVPSGFNGGRWCFVRGSDGPTTTRRTLRTAAVDSLQLVGFIQPDRQHSRLTSLNTS